jgi:hypothetical protein
MWAWRIRRGQTRAEGIAHSCFTHAPQLSQTKGTVAGGNAVKVRWQPLDIAR